MGRGYQRADTIPCNNLTPQCKRISVLIAQHLQRSAIPVAIPDFQSVMLPFLETLQDGKERTMRELTEQLALRFKLTEEERQEHLPSGPQSLFYNRVAWAKTHLKNAGLIDNPVRGKVSISEDRSARFCSRSHRPSIANSSNSFPPT